MNSPLCNLADTLSDNPVQSNVFLYLMGKNLVKKASLVVVPCMNLRLNLDKPALLLLEKAALFLLGSALFPMEVDWKSKPEWCLVDVDLQTHEILMNSLEI